MDSFISAEHIVTACGASANQIAVEVVAETGSTNADLLSRLAFLRQATLLVAEKQTAGRGRAGREWYMEPDASLTCSLAWKFNCPVAQLTGLPLAVGVTLAETLAAWGIEVKLKWPNDVLKEGKKLAGILIETGSARSSGSGQAGTWVVIGIGLNLSCSTDLADKVGMPITGAGILSKDRNRVIGSLLHNLSNALMQFERKGLAAFTARWNELHAYAGSAVMILDHGKILHQGYALGVDASGRLVLDTAQGQVAVMAGEVSLRPLQTE